MDGPLIPTAPALERGSALSLMRQIYDFWRDGILGGRFAGGERVPSTRDMACALGLARGTVTQAYEQLISEGYLRSRRGAGTFVCAELPERLLQAPLAQPREPAAAAPVRLAAFGRRLQHDLPVRRRRAGHIDFGRWGPDLDLFPLREWNRLQARSLRELGATALGYAERTQGYEPLCEQIARYLARSRAVRCTPEQVIIVNGSQQALDLTARLLLEPGDEVVVEDPGYPGAGRAFEGCGARLRAVPVDREGLQTRRLGTRARLVYVTPAHQFPTGAALSLRRRLELISWARERHAVIVEDDYDSEYRYGGAPLPALQGLAGAAAVIYCGTFSNVMFPGLRVGYAVVPPELVAPFTRAKWLSDRQTPLPQQAALYHFLREGHLERHIRRMRRIYGARRDALLQALREHFRGAAQVCGEAAGLQAYVHLDDPGIAARAQRARLQLRSAAAYWMRRAPAGDYLFGFSMLGERSIREGIRRLAAGRPG